MNKINRVVARHQEGMDDKTVFDEILDSNLTDFEKRPGRLMEESINIAVAGTETTAWTLSVKSFRPLNFTLITTVQVLTFHLLTNPDKLAKLKAELKEAIPDPSEPQSIKDMEKLPYLTALISEGLRLSMGTSNRQERVCPDEILLFNDGKKQWPIPRGVRPPIT